MRFPGKNIRPQYPLPGFVSMFINPAAVLDGLREKPCWFGPLAFAALFGAAVNFYVMTRVGYLRLVGDVLKSAPSVDPQAVLETALARKLEIQVLQGASTIASTFLTAFVVAKVIWLILELIGEDVRFKNVLSLAAHVSMLALVVRETMLALTATVMPDLESLDLRNPLATNPAFFLRPDSPVLFRLLSSLDLVTILQIFLLALGLSRLSPHLPFRKSILLVVIPWTVYTAATVLLPI